MAKRTMLGDMAKAMTDAAAAATEAVIAAVEAPFATKKPAKTRKAPAHRRPMSKAAPRHSTASSTKRAVAIEGSAKRTKAGAGSKNRMTGAPQRAASPPSRNKTARTEKKK